ncbi:MAG TPA: metalloregulator ArsR/SmtB family transcription factor [Sporichthyaceae bacterium]|jgi:ArsR family transcriptional regulator|nr:metalloregulator ArsR/SmtB family transcription factor [Sporichthyaceae bacterium]
MGAATHQGKADLFRALSDPTRIRVLETLAAKECSAWELLPAGLRASNLYEQLVVLRRAGLVSMRREGCEVIYALAGPPVAQLLAASHLILTGALDDRVELPAVRPTASPESSPARRLPDARSGEAG